MQRAACWSVLAIGLATVLAAAEERSVDYRKIDRSISREPGYQSDEPLYGLMLFGREAALRVWIVLDGETVYVDHNGDGDLTAADERFATIGECKDVELRLSEGKSRYTITTIGQYDDGEPARVHLMPYVDIAGPLEYGQYGDLALEKSPQEAKLAHYDGPLTAGSTTISWELPAGLKLKTGEKPSELRAMVGTFDKQAECWVVVRSSHRRKEYAFEKGVVPEVEVEFPGKTPEDPVIRKRYPLDGFC